MMTNQRCPICGRPHAPGACPTSGAGSGAPRSILGAAAVPPTAPAERPASVDHGLALLADAGFQGAADQYAALKRDGRTHAEALYAVLSEAWASARDAAGPARDGPPWGSDDVTHWPRAMTRDELERDNASVAAGAAARLLVLGPGVMLKPEPTGPAPWVAPRGECRSCDRRRESLAAARKQKVSKP